MRNSNNNANHTNVIPNLFRNLKNTKILNQVQDDNIRRHPEGDNPKDLQTQSHVITRKDIKQKMQKSVRSDVVIPSKLCNFETCQGLRHWRLLFNLKNNFSKPVRNDMKNKNKLDCFASARNDRGRHPEGDNPKDLSTNANLKPSPEFVSLSQLTNKFYPQLLHTDSHVSPQLNGSLCITKREGKENRNELINLSTYRLIDLKSVKNSVP